MCRRLACAAVVQVRQQFALPCAAIVLFCTFRLSGVGLRREFQKRALFRNVFFFVGGCFFFCFDFAKGLFRMSLLLFCIVICRRTSGELFFIVFRVENFSFCILHKAFVTIAFFVLGATLYVSGIFNKIPCPSEIRFLF